MLALLCRPATSMATSLALLQVSLNSGAFAMTLISSVLPSTAVWEEGEVKIRDPQL